MTRREIFKALLTACTYLNHSLSHADDQKGTMNTAARNYIADFRSGKEFKYGSDVRNMVVNFTPEPAALYLLKNELARGDSFVRRNIVQLLRAIAVACNPADKNRIPIVRDHGIMKILLLEGFGKHDQARAEAAEILHMQCKPSDLAAFNELFFDSIQEGSGAYLLLAAKAKTLRADAAVDKLAKSAAWQSRAEDMWILKVAQAALGNAAIEDEFISAAFNAAKNASPAPKNRFYDVKDARDGSAVAEQLVQLGYIGTQRSLLTACTFLRSPLKKYVPDLSERSVRYDAADAIRFNFPDEGLLYQPKTIADWAAVEQFCRENLSAVFDGPTPNIPRDKVYPLHSPGRVQFNS